MPGVHGRTGDMPSRAENGFRMVPLRGDGASWAAKLELLAERREKVPPTRSTDPWVQPSKAVKLAAHGVDGCTADGMPDGGAVAPRWDPRLEANPHSLRWQGRAQGHPSRTTGSD